MRISSDYKAGAYTIVPDTAEDTVSLKNVFAQKPFNVLKYAGRDGDPTDTLYFTVGSPELHKFVLQGSDESSRRALGGIRDMCFFANPRLVVIEKYSSAEKLVCTGTFCKHCGHPIIGLAAGSEVCDACAEKCKHTYRPSMGLGYGFGQAVKLDICRACHRASPESIERAKKLTVIERFAEAKKVAGYNGWAITNLGHVDVDDLLEFQNTGKLPAEFQAIVDERPEVLPEFDKLRQHLLEAR